MGKYTACLLLKSSMLSLLHHPLSCRYLQSMSIYPSFTHPQSDNLRTMSTLVFLSYTHIYLGTIYSLGYLGRQVLKIIMQPNTFLVISKQSSHQSTVLYRCLSLSLRHLQILCSFASLKLQLTLALPRQECIKYILQK